MDLFTEGELRSQPHISQNIYIHFILLALFVSLYQQTLLQQKIHARH
jgi:hypothetical protein